jgi:hypothetical protein
MRITPGNEFKVLEVHTHNDTALLKDLEMGDKVRLLDLDIKVLDSATAFGLLAVGIPAMSDEVWVVIKGVPIEKLYEGEIIRGTLKLSNSFNKLPVFKVQRCF